MLPGYAYGKCPTSTVIADLTPSDLLRLLDRPTAMEAVRALLAELRRP